MILLRWLSEYSASEVGEIQMLSGQLNIDFTFVVWSVGHLSILLTQTILKIKRFSKSSEIPVFPPRSTLFQETLFFLIVDTPLFKFVSWFKRLTIVVLVTYLSYYLALGAETLYLTYYPSIYPKILLWRISKL